VAAGKQQRHVTSPLAVTVKKKEGLAPAKQKENSHPNFRPRSSFFNPPSHSSPLFFLSEFIHPSFTMGFTDFVSDAGLAIANNFLSTRSYIVG
jgi:hypothetical protein